MTQTMASLNRKIKVAGDLQTVVRTMKAVAASSIGQYEKSIKSLSEYYRTVELGLGVCLRDVSYERERTLKKKNQKNKGGVIVFGSDQGLVGQFNEIVAAHAKTTVKELAGDSQIWTVGERVRVHLMDTGLDIKGTFQLPSSLHAITPLVGQILIETHAQDNETDELYLIYNHRTSGAGFEPKLQRLLPLDSNWQRQISEYLWPNHLKPEVMGEQFQTLKVLIREYLFVSIFRACAQSLASENASRLSAMQRADKNIKDLLEKLKGNYHRLRQKSIDEELFDVVSGFEALSKQSTTRIIV